MNIEIHQPELEALIQQRMDSGRFQSVEDMLFQTLEQVAEERPQPESAEAKPNFAQFVKESPFWKSGLTLSRAKDLPRPADL